MMRRKEGPRRQGSHKTRWAWDLRRRMTDAERKLWCSLRASQVDGLKFRRQVPFGAFYLDFYCARYRVAVEVDGGQHYRPEGVALDERRTAYLRSHGVTVLRYSDRDVLMCSEAVVEDIVERIKDSSPYPSPLRGEGTPFTVDSRTPLCPYRIESSPFQGEGKAREQSTRRREMT